MNSIYLIKNSEESHYKIGVSNNPMKRLSQLQTGCPSELILLETYQSEVSYEIEKVLHRWFSHLKKEGEWFDFSIVEEVEFKRNCEKIENTLKILTSNQDIIF